MVNIYTGSNTVEHFIGGVTKHKINKYDVPDELETRLMLGVHRF